MKISITFDNGERIFIKGDNLQIETGKKLVDDAQVGAKPQESAQPVKIGSKKQSFGRGHRLTQDDIKRIQVLKGMGRTSKEISQKTGYSLATINRYWAPKEVLPPETSADNT